MNHPDETFVIDRNGQRGIIESKVGSNDNGDTLLKVRLDNGQILLIPLSVLTRSSEGAYTLPFALTEFNTGGAAVPPSPSSRSLPLVPQFTSETTPATQSGADPGAVLSHSDAAKEVVGVPQSVKVPQEGTAFVTSGDQHLPDTIVVPVIEEQAHVSRRVAETGGVRIIKTVQEREETVDVPLLTDTADVQRVTVNRMVEAAPEVRRDGDTLVVPLLEEVLVVEKRLMVREELYIRMRREETHQPQQVMLRREEVRIERFDIDSDRGAETTAPTPGNEI